MEEELVNRVANSGLVTINLEHYYPEEEIFKFDIKDFLFQGLILKEKEFRAALKEFDWASVKNKILCVFCSTDAIIPVWAYMLIASNAKNFALKVFTGTKEEYLSSRFKEAINGLEFSELTDKRIVIKGCSDKHVPASAYADITIRLQEIAQSIMYGEPCSTVPVFKRPRSI